MPRSNSPSPRNLKLNSLSLPHCLNNMHITSTSPIVAITPGWNSRAHCPILQRLHSLSIKPNSPLLFPPVLSSYLQRYVVCELHHTPHLLLCMCPSICLNLALRAYPTPTYQTDLFAHFILFREKLDPLPNFELSRSMLG